MLNQNGSESCSLAKPAPNRNQIPNPKSIDPNPRKIALVARQPWLIASLHLLNVNMLHWFLGNRSKAKADRPRQSAPKDTFVPNHPAATMPSAIKASMRWLDMANKMRISLFKICFVRLAKQSSAVANTPFSTG